ncbi:TetR/AcrR family transcriptional regulator [Rhizobacter sp. Root404]|jgi:TetR/AcrR family transcriptional regulator|uniref:TetR/AcrR family transcriptional regulator n=1 Tax=Rhizobacter sp. Root404 TaxID=1736528 RepID=UPI0006FFDEBB|nr:TetR/AcrR family transcriptional regulator [Rhizobacter sp. Root404]KQW36385.1 TetR family transcriptional regulator [Rhizobacter sp. Root404]
MPRGRAPGYDTQREEILARAADLFARQGYTATSMNQVALACGVSKPSLYHYVRDKYQLLVEIAEDHVGRLKELVAQAQQQPLDPQARVRALIASFLEVYAHAQAAHRVLTEDVKFLEPADRERVLDGQREVVNAFAEAIAESRPDLRATELHKPVTMLLFGMMNWMFTWLQPGGKLTHAAMAPIVADLFFGGLNSVQVAGSQPRPQPASAKRVARRA